MKSAIYRGAIVAAIAAGSILWGSGARAAMITIGISGGEFRSESGTPVGTGAMFQLVNLGANGVFDPIGLASWVGGDDSVVNSSFAGGSSNQDGYLSAGSFDLTDGTGTSGLLDRVFNLDFGSNVNPGDKLGIRWFPSIAANNSFGSMIPAGGTYYGQFTRQGIPLYGGSDWIVPDSGSAVIFDALMTSIFGGSDAASLGTATFQTLSQPAGVPEAGPLLPVFAATASLLFWYRRRLQKRLILAGSSLGR